jgi:MFS family permease
VKSVGLPTRAYGLLISTNGLLIVCFELPITTFVQRFRPQPVIALGYLLSGFGFALTGFARTMPALGATVVVWTLGEMISSPTAIAYVAQLAPERYRGRYMGLLTVTWSLGMLTGPPIGTILFARNEMLLWACCGLLGVLGASLLVTLSPQRTV